MRIKPHLSYANVVSSIALFAVLGGGAYAASKIGPEDIKKNAVRTKHIKKDAVTPAKAKGLVEGIASGGAVLQLGGGGEQHVSDVPGFGEIRGGCGSGGGALRLFNQSGLTLKMAISGPGTGKVEDVADGESSSFSGPGPGGAGIHLLQARGGSGADSRVLTVLGMSTEQTSNQCHVRVQVMAELP